MYGQVEVIKSYREIKRNRWTRKNYTEIGMLKTSLKLKNMEYKMHYNFVEYFIKILFVEKSETSQLEHTSLASYSF